MAKKNKLAEMTDEELVKKLEETKLELMNLRFQNATGQLTNHARLGQVRRDAARIKTKLRAREIAAAEALQETR